MSIQPTIPSVFPRTSRQDSQPWTGTSVLITCEAGEQALAEAVGAALATAGAQVETASLSGTASMPAIASSQVLAILPRSSCPTGDAGERLRRMIERLHTVGTLSRSAAAVTFVQFGGGRFGTGPTPADPELCCTAAFARSLHLERPDLRVRVLDLAEALPPEQVARFVLAETAGDAPFAAAGYGADGKRILSQARLQQPARYTPRGLTWSAEDVILVTGGAKGITAECALALARTTGAKLALVGSSPAPGTNGRADEELARTLERFGAEGLVGRYESCNITNADAVRDLVRRVREELGPITGVVHGAGVNKPRRVEQVSAEEAFAEVAPKLLGAQNLCHALADAPPRLLLGFTSIIGVTGMPGNAWYAFSNEALDLVLRRFEIEHPETAVLSIAFSVWGETGMGARMGSVKHLGKMGIGAIPTEEGVRRFLHLFANDPGHKQVVVTARLGGLDTWPIEPSPAPEGLRFLERVVREHPGVELVARTRLTLERDLYLQDHNYHGSYLFPTVFGLEAMTQAAARVTGESNPAVVRIENVSLERPIVVDPKDGVEIEIRAEALEMTANGERPVRVGIRTEQTGFAADHFAATLVLGKPSTGPQVAPPGREPLALDPKTDLYGGLHFQGPRFQKMGRIYELDSEHTVFASAAQEPADLEEQAFAPGQGGRLLLGDPFLRDVLLQAGQVTIPREVCLPVRIEQIERFAPTDGGAGRRFVVAPYKVRKGREYVAEVFVTDEQGRVLERLIGYWLRILEERPDNPTAEELATRVLATSASSTPPWRRRALRRMPTGRLWPSTTFRDCMASRVKSGAAASSPSSAGRCALGWG